jgi:hypothetical protein
MKPTTLTQQEALQILINAVGLAQQKGAFTLPEAGIIANAVATFIPPKEPTVYVDSKPDVAVPQKSSKKTK